MMTTTAYSTREVSPVDALWTLIQGQSKTVRDTLAKRLAEQQQTVEDDENFYADDAGRIILSEEMRNAVDKAELSLMAGECLTEDGFKERFAKWL